MSEITLPFQEQKQQALLGHLLGHESLFKTVICKVKPEWFLTEKSRKVYSYMINYHTKLRKVP